MQCEVPGAYELPFAALQLATNTEAYTCTKPRENEDVSTQMIDRGFDVILCFGVLVKGETMHFEYISQATASGILAGNWLAKSGVAK